MYKTFEKRLKHRVLGIRLTTTLDDNKSWNFLATVHLVLFVDLWIKHNVCEETRQVFVLNHKKGQ